MLKLYLIRFQTLRVFPISLSQTTFPTFYFSTQHLYGKFARQLKHSAARLICHEFRESSWKSCCHLSAHKAAACLPYATFCILARQKRMQILVFSMLSLSQLSRHRIQIQIRIHIYQRAGSE